MRRVAPLLAVVLMAACGEGDDEATADTTAPTARSGLQAAAEKAVAGICSALEAAPQAASVAFHSAHDRLHDIGDALTEVDRAEAGEFLRAKSTVETDISDGAPPEKLQADLTGLRQALAQALDVLDVEVSSTC